MNDAGPDDSRSRLAEMGWDAHFRKLFEEIATSRDEPGRIVGQSRRVCHLVTRGGSRRASVGGKAFDKSAPEDLPVVGDWVVVSADPSGAQVIADVLERKTFFVRKVPGRRSRVQGVAANVDTFFVMMSLNRDFNLGRLERYLVAVWQSGARPVILLTKADVCSMVQDRLSQAQGVGLGVPIHAISSLTGQGLEVLDQYLLPRRTVAMLGSSGVGKSTLANRLLGEERFETEEVRASDDRGRHTTTHRELVRLPGGALLLDNPGLRELQFVDARQGLASAFDDIRELEDKCRFRDCRHRSEPDCAVQGALQSGELDRRRFENYVQIGKEMAYQARRGDQSLELEEKKRRKRIHRSHNRVSRKGKKS